MQHYLLEEYGAPADRFLVSFVLPHSFVILAPTHGFTKSEFTYCGERCSMAQPVCYVNDVDHHDASYHRFYCIVPIGHS